MGIRCVIYLLILNQNKEQARQQTWAAIDLLEALGFLVNYQKSVVVPQQEIVFLGFLLDSKPQPKVKVIQQEARHLLSQSTVSARTLASFIGKLSAAILAIYPAPLHYCSLQHLKHKALHLAGYDEQMKISLPAQEDLRWWVDNLDSWNGRTTHLLSPELEIETDASQTGWGAHCKGEFTGGCWSAEERKLHINGLELMAATFGIQAFCKGRQIRTVLLKSDNTTVVAHINKMGGTRSPILVQLTAVELVYPTRDPRQSTAPSGRLSFTPLARQNRLDSVPGVVLNDQCEVRTSQHSNKVLNSSFEICQLAPGDGCFCSGLDQGATLVIVVPLWQAQAWFPQLVEMLIDIPVLLPQERDIMEPSPNCDCPMRGQVPQLIACKVSGCASKQRDFQRRLFISSWHRGEDSSWKKWQAWCRGEIPIPNLQDVLGFLAYQFEEGRQYRSVNCYRSAISSAHLPIDGFPVGKHPLVCRLLKGALNLRPPLPKYSCVWEVKEVTTYVKNLGDNRQLSLKRLTLSYWL